MIVAGIGCRKNVSVEAVESAIDAALAGLNLDREALGALATIPFKREEAAIREAARRFGLPFMIPDDEALRLAESGVATRSRRVRAIVGTASASEVAALAAAGPGARLIAPRLVTGPVTCAMATKEGMK